MFEKITNISRKNGINNIFEAISKYRDCFDVKQLSEVAEGMINSLKCALCMIVNEIPEIGEETAIEYLSQFVGKNAIEKLIKTTDTDAKGNSKCFASAISEKISFDLNDTKMEEFFMSTDKDSDETVFCTINRMKLVMVDEALAQSLFNIISNGDKNFRTNIQSRSNDEIAKFIDIVVEFSKKINPTIDVRPYFMHNHNKEEIKYPPIIPQNKPAENVSSDKEYNAGMANYGNLIDELKKASDNLSNVLSKNSQPKAGHVNPYSAKNIINSALNYGRGVPVGASKEIGIDDIMRNMKKVTETASEITPANITKNLDQNRSLIECYLTFEPNTLFYKDKILDNLTKNYKKFTELRNEIPAIRKYDLVITDGDNFSLKGVNPDGNLEAHLDFNNGKTIVYCVPYSKDGVGQSLYEYNNA